MNKEDNNFDIPLLDEYLDALQKEMEEDEEFLNYTVPNDWDRDFRAAMQEGFRERRREVQKLIRSYFIKIAWTIAAGVLLSCVSNAIVGNAQDERLRSFVQAAFYFDNTAEYEWLNAGKLGFGKLLTARGH